MRTFRQRIVPADDKGASTPHRWELPRFSKISVGGGCRDRPASRWSDCNAVLLTSCFFYSVHNKRKKRIKFTLISAGAGANWLCLGE